MFYSSNVLFLFIWRNEQSDAALCSFRRERMKTAVFYKYSVPTARPVTARMLTNRSGLTINVGIKPSSH